MFLVSLVGYLNYFDKERAIVEDYILKNDEILSLVGEINSMKLIRIRKVGMDSKGFRYKKYFYRVHGNTKTEDVVIKLVMESDKPDVYRMNYISQKSN